MVDGDTWSWSERDDWCSAHARTQSQGVSPVRSSQWPPSTRTSLNPAVIVITLKSTFSIFKLGALPIYNLLLQSPFIFFTFSETSESGALR